MRNPLDRSPGCAGISLQIFKGETKLPETVSASLPERPAERTTALPRASGGGPKLLDRLRVALRSRHYSRRTEQTYCHWVKRFCPFHNLRHPNDMAEPEIKAFLSHLAVKNAVPKAAMVKRATSHTFGPSFATQLLESGYDIRTVQELLGHKDVKTTMIYTHVLNRGGKGVKSPVDDL